jgi:TAT (twin-arginine translocation) pathway signal sequence
MKKYLNMNRRRFLQSSAALGAGLSLTGQALAKPKNKASLIEIENSKTGTQNWQNSDPAENNEVSGYASATSVSHGGNIDLFIHCIDSSFTLNIYRLGWYNGAGGREMQPGITLPGNVQAVPLPDPQTGMVECNWVNPHRLNIPSNRLDETAWVTGVYVAKITANTSNKQSYIHFVVVDNSNSQADHLFQCSVTTYQAYNNWGGKSLYEFNSTDQVKATKVSFNRPYAEASGLGQFLSYEYSMLRFLEREGYDVSYCTNLDVHANPFRVLSHNNFLSIGHDEYWSWQMRNYVELARNYGVNLSFFSANTCYWQIRLEPSAISGGQNRTMVCYKDAALDPYAAQPAKQFLTTVQWRQAPVNRPENSLIGVMYDFYPVQEDIVITNSSHWVFEKTGLTNGSRLPGLLGYEADRIFPNGPDKLITLASSPIAGFNLPSNMTIYSTRSKSQVFATGSIQWSWGLDNFLIASTGVSVVPAAQQITRNILKRFGR